MSLIFLLGAQINLALFHTPTGSINRYMSPFHKVLMLMKAMMRSPPVTVIFAEDDDFTSMFVEDFLPNLPVRRMPVPTASYQSTAAVRAPSSAIPRPTATAAGPPRQNSEVIELLDDDD